MKEIFTKIWKFLWERTGRKELDSDEIWLLERMDRIAAIEEPDYDRMWERIRRKTICKNSPRVKLWRGVAAVALPMAVICTAVYFSGKNATTVRAISSGKPEGDFFPNQSDFG